MTEEGDAAQHATPATAPAAAPLDVAPELHVEASPETGERAAASATSDASVGGGSHE